MKKINKKYSFSGSGMNPQKFHRSQIKFYIFLLPLVAFMLLPILYIINSAFKPLDELAAFPPRFFANNPTLKNFTDLGKMSEGMGVPITRYLFNSIIITIAVVSSTVLISSAAGYVLSKRTFKGKKLLNTINTLALMFVPIAVAIPRYFIIVRIGILDTFLAHILPLLAMPIGLFLVKQFIDQVPDALIEAAHIDGASCYRVLFTIIMPIIKPALATVAILSFQSVWNSTETSTLFVNRESIKTFAYSLSVLSNTGSNTAAGQGIAAAASMILFLPNLIIFVILQSRVMNTLVHSGIK